MANVIKGYILKDGLDVGGSANVAGALKVDGATTLAAVTSTNITSSGFINVASTANVGGATNLRGALTVNGSTIIANTLAVGNTSITGFINASSSANIAGTLQVAGATSFTNILGAGNTTVTGFINVSSTANVGGATTLRSTLDVTGATAITNILGAGNTTVTGFINATSTIQVGGVATFGSGASVSGNLGVGTTSPSTKLHVSGTGDQELRVSTVTSGNSIVSLRAEGVNGGSIIYNRLSSLLQLENAGATALNITTGGNVGVGVVPTYKLDVAGVIRSTSGNEGGAHFWGFTTASASSRTWAFYNDYAAFGDFTLLQSSTQTGNPTTSRMYFDASGNLGLSEASPTSRLHVNGMIQARNGTTGISISGDGTNGYINGVGANPVIFQINSTERMRFDTSGNIILTGNLIVSGTTTYVNTAILNVADNIISLNSDLPSGSAPTENAGIEVNRGSSANSVLRWNESTDIWEVTNDGTTYGRIHSKLADVALGTDTSGNYVATVTNGNGISISGSGVESATVTVTAATGNGMALDANGIRALAGNTQLVSNTSGLWVIQSNIDHNSLANYAANRHVDHSTVSITAGNGLTGGGDITASRTLDVGAANGIVVSADTVGVVAGSGIVVDVSGVSHADTSSVTNLTASGRTYVTGLSFDTYGHVTGYTTGSESVVDTNTTYSVKASVQTGGAGLDLDAGGSGSGTDTVKILGSGTTTVTRTDADTITIGSADQFVGTVTSVSGGAGLTGSFSTSGSLAVGAGVGITVNADDVAVNAQSGLIANSTGLYVNATSIALGTVPTARLPAGSTSATGIVQLTDSVASTSTSTAATPNSVKSAYDLANGKAATNQTFFIGTTSVAINRTTGNLSLTGVSIDGTAGGVAWGNISSVPSASTTGAGIVQLSDSVATTSSTLAATSTAVKSAYDLAATKANAGQTFFIGTTSVAINRASGSLSLTGVSIDGTAGGVAWGNISSVPSASTTGAGIVQLTDSVASTSTSTAATPNSVKTAYDLAATKANAGQTFFIGTTSVAINRTSGSLSLTGVSIDGTAGGVAWGNISSIPSASTSVAGIVQLTDSVSSTSTSTAATPNSVKSAYDLAATKANVGQTFFIGTTSVAINRTSGSLSLAGVSIDGTAASTPLLSTLSSYPWSLSALPNTYQLGIQSTFVGPDISEGSWQNYGSVMTMRTYSGGGGSLQMYVPYGPNNGGTGLQVRFGNYEVSSGNSWTSWKTLLASDNYNDYAPTKTGGGASGSWGISVTGSAGSVAWSGVSGVPSASTSGAGIVQLTDSVSSTSTSTAATPNSVKSAYDLANGKAATGQTFYIGTTQVAINRGSGSLSLTGVSIDGTAGGVAWGNISSIPSASTSGAGIVQLSDSTSTTSSTLAATSTAVKSAYDLANGKAATNQTMYIGTTAVAINRGSGSLSLTGVSIDGSAGSAAAVTVTNSDAASTYNMVWHSSSSLYSTAGIYCNPSTDVMYAADFQIPSDDRLKNRLGNVSNALAAVNSLNGFKFTWNDTATELRNYTSDTTKVGISAQEVEAILPEAVNTNEDGYKTVSYDSLVPLLIEAVKELSKKVAELEAK